jgi:spermidine/putrescine transport system permease protein
MGKKRRVSLFFFVLVQIFFYAPLLMLAIFSFNDSKTMLWGGFSFRWYHELFCHSPALWKAFLNSIIVALISSTSATIIGTLGAIGIYWYDFRLKKYLQALTFLPIILPEIIIGVSLLIFFAALRLKLSLFTIILAHVTFNIPFVLLIVMARLEEFDYGIIEAAYDLGAREIDALLRVIIPLCMPGILSGFLLAITLSLEDFVITFFVAGPGSSTLPLYVYSMIRFGVSPAINALSVVIIAGTMVLAASSRNLYKYIIQK